MSRGKSGYSYASNIIDEPEQPYTGVEVIIYRDPLLG
jgi:hypothetical protein